jgi:hypothetical protein
MRSFVEEESGVGGKHARARYTECLVHISDGMINIGAMFVSENVTTRG